MVRMLARDTKGRGFDSRPLHYQEQNIGQVVHMHMPLSPSSIIWYWSRGGDAVAWKATVSGLASHWPCVTDFSGLSIYGLTA